MRQIGSLADEQQSRLIAEYLLAKGIPARSEPEGRHWSIWVREENDVEPAKRVFADFLQSPSKESYRQVVEAAGRQLQQQRAAQRADQRRQSQRPNPSQVARAPDTRAPDTRAPETRAPDTRAPGTRARPELANQPAADDSAASGRRESLSSRAPLVMVLIGLSLFVGLITDAGRLQNDLFHALMTVDLRLYDQPEQAFRQILSGQVWRLITPIFLHGSWLHLLFNLSWIYYFGVQIETRRGTVRFGVLVLSLALASNLTQLLGVGPNFLGMSGVAYGLFGYVWAHQLMTRGQPQTYVLSEFSIFVLMFFLVMGFANGLNGLIGEDAAVANGAHVGGLVAGMVISFLDVVVRR